jgi:2-keto-4-pentenoate hydratase
VPQDTSAAAAIARRFVDARLSAAALPEYPGGMPGDLASAYAIQDAAIGLWPDDIAGWKIGLVSPELRGKLGVDRIAGPIFARQVLSVSGGETCELPVFKDGFAAVEAEFVLKVGRDQPAGQTGWTAEQAAKMIGAVHIGIELAGSPFAGINDFGPAITVSDFKN